MDQFRKKENINSSYGKSGEATARAFNKEKFVDQIISEWKFYLPGIGLTKRILLLNADIGDAYFAKLYAKLDEEEKTNVDSNSTDFEESVEINENLNDLSWHQRLLKQVSSVIFHDEKSFADKSEVEKIGYFQRYISERIYNHLAMLARSPHAEEGGAFSLKNDFAEEIARKIGLGLYFSDDISENIRAEIKNVLYKLAKGFQDWFINEKNGYFSATFAEVYSFERRDEAFSLEEGIQKLILHADIENDEINAVVQEENKMLNSP